MEPLGYVIIVGGSSAAAVGFIAGLLATRFRAAPVIATAVIIAVNVVVVSIAIGWTASCPSCEAWRSEDSTRILDVYFAIFWGFIVGAPIIGIIWLGALFSRLLPRPHKESA